MYTSHLSVLRTELVREVGGFREGFDGSQDHDLVLRVTERRPAGRARPRGALPLARRRRARPRPTSTPSPTPTIAGRRAVQDHLDRLGHRRRRGHGPRSPAATCRRVGSTPRRGSRVVIPTIGQSALICGARRVLVVEAVRSLLARTEPRRRRDRRRPRQADAADGPRRAPGGRGRPAGPGAVRPRPFNFSEKMQRRRPARLRRPAGVPQRRRRGHLATGWLEQLVGAARRARRRPDRRQALLQRRHRPARRARLLQRGDYHHPFRFCTRDEASARSASSSSTAR